MPVKPVEKMPIARRRRVVKRPRKSSSIYKKKRTLARRGVKRARVSSRRSRTRSTSHNLMDVIKGRGAYTSSVSRTDTSPPSMHSTKDGFSVRHREFIQDITATQAFGGIALPINPGLPSVFPWLSQIAQNFEEWVPKGMCWFDEVRKRVIFGLTKSIN